MLTITDKTRPYEERHDAFVKAKLRRKKKLQKYLEEKFRRNFRKLPHIQARRGSALRARRHDVPEISIGEEDEPKSNEYAEKVLRRLSNFSSGAWNSSTSNELTREDSLSATGGTRLPPLLSPLQKTPSKTPSTGEKQSLSRTSSMLIKDQRRSKAFLDMSEDLQAIIASHSTDAAVEIAKMQVERSSSILSESEMDSGLAMARKLSLDEMVARLPYGIHFKQYGLADVDLDVKERPVSRPIALFSTAEERSRISLDRRILEFNDLSVSADEVPTNQLKLVIIGHPLAAGNELTALLTTAVNMLSDRCRTIGMSLVIFNSSWGYPNEMAPEAQAYEQLESLEKFLQPDGSLIVILMLLNDKYGQYIFPQKLPEEVYQHIFNCALEAHERALEQIAILNRQQKEKDERLSTAEGRHDERLGSLSKGEVPKSREKEPAADKQNEQTDEESEEGGEGKKRPSKFRKTVRSLQQHSLLLRSVIKDFDPYINDPVALSKWYAQKPLSTNIDYHLIDHRIRFPNLRSDNGGPEYHEERMKLENLIQKYGQNNQIFKYSAFANEILCVLRHLDYAETFVAIRRFVDFNPHDKEAVWKFANYNRGRSGMVNLDTEAVAQMDKLLKLVTAKVPGDRRVTSAVRWSSQGLNPTASYEHMAYVEKIVTDAVNQVTDCLSRFVNGQSLYRWSSTLTAATVIQGNSMTPTKPPPQILIDDIAIHLHALQKNVKKYKYDYGDQLNECMSLIGENQYVFVSGLSGSGKSVLLAKIATELREKLVSKRCNPIVVYRQIGLTNRSLNVRLLLCDLKKQIDHMFFARKPPPPSSKLPFDTSYLGIENELEKTLALASKERPFFIVLDGILRLLDFYHGPNLKWLSQNRNEHIHIVLSLATQEEAVAEAVKSALTNKAIPCGFYRMKPLPVEVVRQHMETQLVKSEIAVEGLVDEYLEYYAQNNSDKDGQISSFLLLDLVCRKMISGCSDVAELPTSLKSAIGAIFNEAEAKLGDLVVRRAIGYLVTARVGLTRLELADLLTQDSAVSVHLRNSLSLPIFLTPPSIVSCLLDILLAPLLSIRKCDNWPLTVFSYSAARHVAYDRYVAARAEYSASFGRELTDYFMSTWSTQPRYVDTIRRYERVHVCSQPISLSPDPKWHLNSAKEHTNMRRIDELPFAEMLAGQKSISLDSAKGDCYINYDFLLSACRARGLAYILDIFQWVSDHRSEPDEELTLVYESLKLSRVVLQRDISQLGSQLCARLAGPVSKDSPLAPGDPPKLLNIRSLIRAISTHRSQPSLVPSGSALMSPSNKALNFELHGGHRLPLTAMAVSDDSTLLLTSSQDNKMILWDLRIGGRIIRLVHNIGAEVVTLLFARNNEIALVVEPHRFSAWNISTAEMITVLLNDFIDPLVVNLFKGGSMLASGLNNSSKISIWSLANDASFGKVQLTIDLSEHLDAFLKSPTAGLIMPLNTSPDSLILVTALRTNFAIAWNVETNKLAQKLRIAHKFGSIQAVGRGEEIFAVAYMAYEENNRAVISVIDIFLTSEKYQLLHTIHGCRYDEIDKLYVNATGSHALCMFKNYLTNTSHFMFWNLETEDHKHLSSYNGIIDLVSMSSLNVICTSDKRTSRILVWNLAAEVTKRIPKYKPKYYVAEIQRMQNYSQYAVTRTSNNGPITVWNCLLGRCAGKSVRIEHGVTGEITDVLLLRNARLLVLTEVKSISGGSSDAPARTQIFSAFRLYDILRRVLLKRVANCIVPLGSSSDFVYFDVNRFMGLSESRTEFIVWDVETGAQVMRIKPTIESMLEILDPVVSKIRGRRPSAQRVSTAHRRFLGHLQTEYRNSIHEFLVSDDMSTIVTSHYGHFLCVVDCTSHWFRHTQTLMEPDSLLLLTVSSLSSDGSYLATYSYDELVKMPYITVWDTHEGTRVRRMAGQRGVGALAISKDLNFVLIGKESGEMRIWEPNRHGSERVIEGYPTCSFQPGKSRIYLSEDCTIAFCLTAEISAWDIIKGTVLAVFSSDVSIQCMNVALGGKMAVFGTSESANLITLKLSTLNYTELAACGQDAANMFGELREPAEDNDMYEDDSGI